MTRDEILNMPAGREMDVLIAEKVMGGDFAPATEYYFRRPFGRGPEFIKHYSTDIKAAWDVVERLKEKSEHINLDFAYGEWSCIMPFIWGHAETSPLAICRAALLAVLENET